MSFRTLFLVSVLGAVGIVRMPGCISGTVSGAVVEGVAISLAGPVAATTATDARGKYEFLGLVPGTYTVTPSKAGYRFTPQEATVTVRERSVTRVDFVASTAAGPPPPPTDVAAFPGNGEATVTWTASADATGYRVYYATTPGVGLGDPWIGAAASPAVVPGLENGTAYWFAVTASNAAGESAPSAVGCAVPTAASQAGMTFRDPLCGSTLSGLNWWPNGGNSMEVSGGEAVLSAAMDTMEPYGANGAQYAAPAGVNAGSARVTTLRAQLRVPAESVELTGSGARVRAGVRLIYSPPGKRLNFPRAFQDVLLFEVGLQDAGDGLQAVRQVTHCDDPACSAFSPSGIAFVDPVGFVPISDGEQAGAPASYGTSYVVEVRIAETEGTAGIFHWSIAGGEFGAGVSGTADPAAYLAGAPGWAGISLSGTGFFFSQLSSRVLDRSAAGGGRARISAHFDDVWVGTNDGAAAPHDDFSGAGGNSGPVELSLAKWSVVGAQSIAPSGGALGLHLQATSAGATASFGQGLILANPAPVNAIQADLRIPASSAGAGASANAHLGGRFYNDGTAGAAPGSAVGDVWAGVYVGASQNAVSYLVGRCLTLTCAGALGSPVGGAFPGATVGTGVHTVLVRWDPGAQRFTFGYDGTTITVDPTATAPVAGPANAPLKRIFTGMGVPGTAGVAASIDVRVNNVFVAP